MTLPTGPAVTFLFTVEDVAVGPLAMPVRAAVSEPPVSGTAAGSTSSRGA